MVANTDNTDFTDIFSRELRNIGQKPKEPLPIV